jgi:hypothetical protein
MVDRSGINEVDDMTWGQAVGLRGPPVRAAPNSSQPFDLSLRNAPNL